MPRKSPVRHPVQSHRKSNGTHVREYERGSGTRSPRGEHKVVGNSTSRVRITQLIGPDTISKIKKYNKQYRGKEWSCLFRVGTDGEVSMTQPELGTAGEVTTLYLQPAFQIGRIHSHPPKDYLIRFSPSDVYAGCYIAKDRYLKSRRGSIRGEPVWYEFVTSQKTGSITGMRFDGSIISRDDITKLKSFRERDKTEVVKKLKKNGGITLLSSKEILS